MDIVTLLFWLLVGHAVMDFSLQTDTMAKGKNRNRPVDPSVIPPGQKFQPTWGYWLTSHALHHGGAVALVTGRIDLGIAEAVAHWGIDFGKCESWYGIHVDQGLHIACKLAWLWVAL